MQVNAELTQLTGRSGLGSPIKDGQIIKNTIIVKDGESVLLGGLSRTFEQTTHKRFPILGHILPFLFSRKTTREEEIQSYIILTPHVVDLSPTLDDGAKRALEGE